MSENQIKIKIENFRAIEKAEIILDGITVLAGENGSGKSTVSKIAYHIFKTSADYDLVVDDKLREDLTELYKLIEQITLKERIHERPNLMRLDYEPAITHIKTRLNQYPLILRDAQALYESNLESIVKSLKVVFGSYFLSNHPSVIKKILADYLDDFDKNKELDFLLDQLNKKYTNLQEKALVLKKERPIHVIEVSLAQTFYDDSPFRKCNVEEYGEAVLNYDTKKVNPIYSIQDVAYTDTPMTIGLNTKTGIPHWDDLAELLAKQENKNPNFNKTIDAIFKTEILNGDIHYESTLSPVHTFSYKRADGKTFNLLECATGLKSFALLQLLYKNGFFTKKSLLILDEPEAHLHPQWIIEYARMIVLLHKYTGAKFLIANHHPDMISGLKYIYEKEVHNDKLHFYLAEKATGKFYYQYKDLGKDIEPIFTSLNMAFERIDAYGKTE